MNGNMMRKSILVAALGLLGCGPSGPGGVSDGPTDGTLPELIPAQWIAQADLVYSSQRFIVGRDAPVCTDTDGGDCLQDQCGNGEQCIFFASFMYESTPAASGGNNLSIDAIYSQLVAGPGLPEAAPILLVNHGGASIGNGTLAQMLQAMEKGYTVLASHYRGAGMSDGEVEGCLGEGDDVKILADLARMYEPNQFIGYLGGSHGGCVTLQALLRGAPVDAAAVLFPGTDGARRYKFNKTLGASGSGLETSANGGCAEAQANLNFIRNELIDGTEEAYGGEVPNWDTEDYHCDDPGLGTDASAWDGMAVLQDEFCSRSPLYEATALDNMTNADVLIVHGERDPYIEYTEACRFVGAAGGFTSYRQVDDGTWVGNGDNPCSSWTTLTSGAPPQGIPGSRNFILFEAYGHGDEGRPSLENPCLTPKPAAPGVANYLYDFLAARR